MAKLVVKDSKGFYVQVVTSGCHKDDLEILEAIYMVDGEELEGSEVDYIYDNYFSELLQANLEGAIDAAESMMGER